MKTKRNVFTYTVGMAMVLIFLAIPGLRLWAGTTPSGTVLSVVGEAFVKQTPQAEWGPLKKGDQVKEGNIIKINPGPEALIRVLTPTGSMVKVPAGNEVIVSFGQKEAGKEEGGFSTFVAEFFSPNTRTRINAVRALVDELMKDWNAFCQFDSISPDNIEKYLEISASYQNENTLNRTIFILWKLHDLFPENEGLKALAAKAIGQYENPGKWEIEGVINNQEKEIESGMPISKGEAITFKYRSPQESYVYLFNTAKTADGHFKTTRLFPGNANALALENYKITGLGEYEFFTSRIAPEEAMYAKEDGVTIKKDNTPFSEDIKTLKKGQPVEILKYGIGRRYYVKADDNTKGWILDLKLTSSKSPIGRKSGDLLAELMADDNRGTKYVWGFSSPGPLPAKLIDNAIAEVEKNLGNGEGVLNEQSVKKAIPEICGSVKVLQLVNP